MKHHDSNFLNALTAAVGFDLSRQYVRFILAETPRNLIDLRITLKEQDYARLLTSAQVLKEVADGLGAKDFSTLVSDILTAYTANDVRLAQSLVQAAEEEWKRVACELELWTNPLT